MNSSSDPLDLPALVRERDYRRFLAIQVAPRARRPILYALTALAGEMAHIPHHVKEPLAGFMRYAWWREALEEIQTGKPARHHPLLQALESWLVANPEAFARLDALIADGQHALENDLGIGEVAEQNRQLDRLWSLALGPEQGALKSLHSLPKNDELGPLVILKLLLRSMRS